MGGKEWFYDSWPELPRNLRILPPTRGDSRVRRFQAEEEKLWRELIRELLF